MLYSKDIVLFVLFRICVTDELYKEQKQLMTWSEANDNCTLATPELAYKVDGQILTVKIDQNITHDENGIWLGYYRNLRGFEYIGFFRYLSLRNITDKSLLYSAPYDLNCVGCIGYPSQKGIDIPSKDIKDNSPGNCLSVCGHDVTTIGLMDHKCYCFGRDITTVKVVSASSCNITCLSSSKGLACGGKSHVSVYVVNQKVQNISVHRNNITKNCVRLAKTPLLSWDQCDLYLQSVCKEGTSDNTFIAKSGQNFFPWNRANNFCFDNNKGQPLSYEDAIKYKNTSFQSWTGICRSFSVFLYFEPIFRTDHIEYGYLKKSSASNQFEVHFTNEMTEIKQSLCRYHTSKAKEHESDINKAGTVVAIVVSVAIIFLIVVVIVVYVVLRNKKTTLCQYFSASKNDNVSDTDDINPDYNTSKNSIENISSLKTSNPLYHECTGSNIEDSNIDDNNPHTYFVLEKEQHDLKGVYNVAGPGHFAVSDDQRNNYNQCKIGENSTYDRLNTPSKLEDKGEYDTTKIVAAQVKTKTNTDNFQDSLEDTYNHLNVELSKNIKTDNVYGIPFQVENSKDGRESQNSSPQEDVDPYNHINTAVMSKAKTDNVYGAP